MIKIKYIIITLMAIILFDDLLYLYTNISIFGKSSALLLTVILFSYYISKNKFSFIVLKYILLFLLVILCNFIINILFVPDTLYLDSFIYEVYKLGVFFTLFILVFLNKRDSISIVHYSINLFSIFVILNLVILILQHLFGSTIIKYIGITSSVMDFQADRNRPSGITTGANIVGVASLFIMIFFYYIKTNANIFMLNTKQRLVSNWLFIASILSIVLSTSKNSLLLLLIFPFFINKLNLKFVFLGIALSIISFVILIEYNLYGLSDKLQMYQYIINNYGSFNSSLIEHRALSILSGLEIFFQNFPFGAGLGTWGDFSSSFNPYVIEKNTMSDSYFVHLLVEQGLLLFLYFFLLFNLLKFDSVGYFTFFSLLMVFLPTMGFGSSTFPYIFSYLLFVFNLKNKLEKRVNDEA